MFFLTLTRTRFCDRLFKLLFAGKDYFVACFYVVQFVVYNKNSDDDDCVKLQFVNWINKCIMDAALFVQVPFVWLYVAYPTFDEMYSKYRYWL